MARRRKAKIEGRREGFIQMGVYYGRCKAPLWLPGRLFKQLDNHHDGTITFHGEADQYAARAVKQDRARRRHEKALG